VDATVARVDARSKQSPVVVPLTGQAFDPAPCLERIRAWLVGIREAAARGTGELDAMEAQVAMAAEMIGVLADILPAIKDCDAAAFDAGMARLQDLMHRINARRTRAA
jgi:hypothetical protein